MNELANTEDSHLLAETQLLMAYVHCIVTIEADRATRTWSATICTMKRISQRRPLSWQSPASSCTRPCLMRLLDDDAARMVLLHGESGVGKLEALNSPMANGGFEFLPLKLERRKQARTTCSPAPAGFLVNWPSSIICTPTRYLSQLRLMKALLFCGDLFFSSRVSPTAERAGYDLQVAMNAADFAARLEDDTKLVLVDLGSSGDIGATVATVRQQAASAKIIAFGPHVQTGLLQAAQAAGCDSVMSNGQFDQNMLAIFESAT